MTSDLSQLGFLLFVSALVAMLTRRLHLPYTVGLVLAGMGLYFSGIYLKWHLSKELIFSVFLPPLVFEAALFIHWGEFRKDLPVVGLLASAGVVLAAAVTAGGMHYGVDWEWGSAAVFGVLIAATDPVSVIATFKQVKVPWTPALAHRSREPVGTMAPPPSPSSACSPCWPAATKTRCRSREHCYVTIVGGVLVGGLVAAGLMLLAGRTPDNLVEITFTTLAAYGSFFIAEHYHLSGVLAALTAGLVVGNFRTSGLITHAGRQALGPFWEYAAFVANSLIFLLIGAQEAEQHFNNLWAPVVLAVILVTLGRAIAIYPLCAAFSRSRLKVDIRHQHVLFWGGLRGALALALALALPQDLPRHDDIVSITFAVVAFSVFVQGLTITPLLRRLKLSE